MALCSKYSVNSSQTNSTAEISLFSITLFIHSHIAGISMRSAVIPLSLATRRMLGMSFDTVSSSPVSSVEIISSICLPPNSH